MRNYFSLIRCGRLGRGVTLYFVEKFYPVQYEIKKTIPKDINDQTKCPQNTVKINLRYIRSIRSIQNL